jgi:hypothetical protein
MAHSLLASEAAVVLVVAMRPGTARVVLVRVCPTQKVQMEEATMPTLVVSAVAPALPLVMVKILQMLVE